MATALSTVRAGTAKSRLGDESGWLRRLLCPGAIFTLSNSKGAWFDPGVYGCYYQGAGWSSPVARWAHNPKVPGSNPGPATNSTLQNKRDRRALPSAVSSG